MGVHPPTPHCTVNNVSSPLHALLATTNIYDKLTPTLDNISVCSDESKISDLEQLDGNVSFLSDKLSSTRPRNDYRNENASVAHHLPVVAVSNMRSLFPKVENFKTDMFERQIDASLLCEVWEQAENVQHKADIEKMLEMEGLKYFSTPRPQGKRGGGAAIVVNTEKFQAEKLNRLTDIQIPAQLEVVWALVRP